MNFLMDGKKLPTLGMGIFCGILSCILGASDHFLATAAFYTSRFAAGFFILGFSLFLVDDFLDKFVPTRNIRGYLLARLWYWVQSSGVTINAGWIMSKIHEQNFQQGNIESYSAFIYHSMTEDWPRMKAFREAAAKAGERWASKSIDERPVWIDIGCGQDFPLTRMVFEAGAGKHVHMIEANPRAWPVIDAALGERAPYRQFTTLHKHMSTQVEFPSGQRADALIHELIGTVASSEGMLHIIADAEMRLLKPGARMIPSYVATHALPISAPFTSAASWLVNTAHPTARSCLPSNTGAYLVFGNVDAQRLADKAHIIEEYRFGDEVGAKPAAEQMRQFMTVVWNVERAGTFSGILLSCVFKGYGQGFECDALACNTNWGKVFVRLAPVGEEVPVAVGDSIKVTFDVDAQSIAPRYVLAAEVLHEGNHVSSHTMSWQGP